MNIAVVSIGRLREALCALPLLSTLRTAYPQAHIIWLCRSALLERLALFNDEGLWDELLGVDTAADPSLLSERFQGKQCERIINADCAVTPFFSALASILQAQQITALSENSVNAAWEGMSSYERHRLLLQEVGLQSDVLPVDEARRQAAHWQARAQSALAQLAEFQRICDERLQALESMNQALTAIREESERRGIMLTDMTMLAQEQEMELLRLRGVSV